MFAPINPRKHRIPAQKKHQELRSAFKQYHHCYQWMNIYFYLILHIVTHKALPLKRSQYWRLIACGPAGNCLPMTAFASASLFSDRITMYQICLAFSELLTSVLPPRSDLRTWKWPYRKQRPALWLARGDVPGSQSCDPVWLAERPIHSKPFQWSHSFQRAPFCFLLVTIKVFPNHAPSVGHMISICRGALILRKPMLPRKRKFCHKEKNRALG